MLHPHQHMAIVAELSKPEYGVLAAEAAFLFLANPARLRDRLGTVRFLTSTQLAALLEKHRPLAVVLIDDATVLAFPSGVPGFPNKLRREWFDRAWTEARG